jgi:glycosyltransferase involved in cell wall biosynthesis
MTPTHDGRGSSPGSPLSVLYVVHGFPPDTWAGTEVYTLGLAQEMRRRGHRVTILARAPARADVARGGPPDWTIEESLFEGLPVWRVIRRIDGLSIRESYRAEGAPAMFRSVLERVKPDVVHFQHLLHLSAELVHVARERGLPCAITCNDYWPLCARVQLIRPDGVRCEENQGMGCLVCLKNRDYRKISRARHWFPLAHSLVRVLRYGVRESRVLTAIFKRVLRRDRLRLALQADQWFALRERQDFVLGCFAAADLLLAPSRFLRDKLLATGHFDPDRVAHSDYGMRVPSVRGLEKAQDSAGKVRFAFVGSLLAYKGVDVLVDAMRKLAGSPCRLIVFGDFRPDTDAFHARLRELARGADVEFRGRFENQRLAEIYREIDVLVVPSVWFENSPLTIHEAFLERTPVVASGIGGMAELVRDGIDGLHFRAGDAQDLSAKLARFVHEPELVARLSHAFADVKSIERDGEEMEARYRALVAARSSTRAPAGALG